MNRITIYPDEDESTSVPVDSSTNQAMLSILSTDRWLALGAVAGPVLFTLAWFILGFLSPGYILWDIVVDEYSPISQPISGLGLGLTAPYMNAAFIISGLLVMIGTVGIFRSIPELGSAARWACTLLMALTGMGSVIAGIFTLESIIPHTMGFLLGIGTPVLSFLVIGLLLRRIPRWRRFGSWMLLGSPLTLLLLIPSFVTFDPVAAGEGIGVAGLAQRVLVTEVLGSIAAMGWKAYRHS
jgi:Protein of unknown function (DUF998)